MGERTRRRPPSNEIAVIGLLTAISVAVKSTTPYVEQPSFLVNSPLGYTTDTSTGRYHKQSSSGEAVSSHMNDSRITFRSSLPCESSLGPVDPSTVKEAPKELTAEQKQREERSRFKPPLDECLNLHDFEVCIPRGLIIPICRPTLIRPVVRPFISPLFMK